MIEIKTIPSKATFSVRQPILRPGKSLSSCVFDGDDLESTVHFGLYIDEDLVGVVSVFENRNAVFNDISQIQIRGMAVLDEHQKKGLGNFLINHVEKYAKSQNVSLIWFNARETAVQFYKKLQYTTFGSPFDIKDIGIHYVMCKQLQEGL